MAGVSPGTLAAHGAEQRREYERALCGRLGVCPGATPDDRHTVASAALGNLLGSITFFHGRQLVAAPSGGRGGARQPPRESEPHGLYTGVPSRSFFPRGFLWDEGFHQLVASQWSPALAGAVVGSWLDTMDASGWIAREQILGEEARSRVPAEFQVQRPDIANPPTLLLPLLALAVDALCPSPPQPHSGEEESADRVAAFCARRTPPASSAAWEHSPAAGAGACRFGCRPSAPLRNPPPLSPGEESSALSPAAALALLARDVPRAVRHYEWFLHTQAAGGGGAGARAVVSAFRWRGATAGHNFASGLDDYPRGLQPHDADENVDALAWMGMSARVLADLCLLVGDAATAAQLGADAARFDARMEHYWVEEAGAYCDVGVTAVAAQQQPQQSHPPTLTLGPVCHVGYVSILPLVLRMVPPDSPHLGATLTAMASPAVLLSPYGLRALSARDPFFHTGEDYWRSAVWLNINYLAVAALRYYAGVDGPHAAEAGRLAAELEERVVGGVVGEYARSGFLWESYDSGTGAGRGTHPFTGWTALVALMVGGKYPI